MANQEHVDRLLRRVDAWNAWRRKKPGAKIYLRKAILSGADLRDANLSGAGARIDDL